MLPRKGDHMLLGGFLVFIPLLLLLAGCAPKATRYTWVGNEADLPQTNLACARDMQNAGYIPAVAAARTSPSTGALVGGVIPTLYKDCVEKHGYVKNGTDTVPLVWDQQLWRWRPETYPCGNPDQTCLWVTPEGWGVAPLPEDRSRPRP
jgi:hypothetical protein